MLKHIPLLQKQRDLYDLPKSRERFNSYIATMTDAAGDLELPLSGLNPMAGDHVPKLLDTYLALEVDRLANEVTQELAQTQQIIQSFAKQPMRTAFVLADDSKGGWTHRVAYEFEQIQLPKALFRRGWLVAFLWSSEAPCWTRAENALKTIIFRGTWIAKHGFGKTLEAFIKQEGWVANQLNQRTTLSAEDLDYTGEILKPLLQNKDEATLIAALFGDRAAAKLGHPPLGLSGRAGIEWGLFCHSDKQSSSHLF